MERSKLLQSAMDACVSRGAQYDKPENNFGRIAALWNAHLMNAYGVEDDGEDGILLTATDVAIMCALIKVARLEHDPAHLDSWTDLAGYAACGAEVSKAGEPQVNSATYMGAQSAIRDAVCGVPSQNGEAIPIAGIGSFSPFKFKDADRHARDCAYKAAWAKQAGQRGAICEGNRVFYYDQSGGKRWGSVTTVSSNSPHVLVLCDDAVPKWFGVNELTAT